MKIAVALLSSLVLVAGCYETRYAVPPPAGMEIRAHGRSGTSSWRHFFVLGLVPGPKTTIIVPEECGPAGAETIETGQSAAQVIVSLVARTIYAPYSVRVTCAATPSRGR